MVYLWQTNFNDSWKGGEVALPQVIINLSDKQYDTWQRWANSKNITLEVFVKRCVAAFIYAKKKQIRKQIAAALGKNE